MCTRFYRSKIIENLAVVNYDTNNLYLAPYDWRLSLYNLEERDGYFSKLKYTIEGLKYAFIDILCRIYLTEWLTHSFTGRDTKRKR